MDTFTAYKYSNIYLENNVFLEPWLVNNSEFGNLSNFVV